MFQPAKAQHENIAQLKPSGVGVPGTLSPGTPLYVLRCHPSDPGYEKKKGPPGYEIAMLVYISRFTMVHKSYVCIYIWLYMFMIYIYIYLYL